jgi:hypothetical protein
MNLLLLSLTSDVELENGRVFSNKRRNLIKLAAKTLSIGVNFFQRRFAAINFKHLSNTHIWLA